MDSLTANVIKFVDVLREAGVRVSISESIDAVSSLKYIYIMDREQVKASLSACLAKSEEEKKIFSRIFDTFFVTPEVRSDLVKSAKEHINREIERIEEEVSDLKFQGEQIELTDELKEAYADLSEIERESILEFLDKTSGGKNVKPSFKETVECVIQKKLSSHRAKSSSLKERSVYNSITSEAGIIASKALEDEKDRNLLTSNIAEISDEDVPAVINLIKAVVEKLKRNISRRYKKSSRKARLDIKKTIRGNLSTGGTLFKLSYKKKPRNRQKVLIMCDVSASMYRFSGFVLQFILGMNSSFSLKDIFIFSDEVEHLNINEFLNAADFEEKIRKSSVWRKGTNINIALKHTLEQRSIALNSSTVVLLVSDAKTLEVQEVKKNIKKLDDRVKEILWLNPIPEAGWEKVNGVEEFRKHCTMLDCSTLERLSRACMII